jgi:His-Xaa-Ser repeat protein HxsA
MKKRSWAAYLKKVLRWSAPLTATVSSIWTPAPAGGSSATLPAIIPLPEKVQPLTFAAPNRIDGTDRFAGHSSHSSHASHASHASHSSHYSSSGSGDYSPSPPPAPSIPSYSPPSPSPSETYTPRTPGYVPPRTQEQLPSTEGTVPSTERPTQIEAIVMTTRVQLELKRLRYYSGIIDGKMSAETRAALRAFQHAQGLTETGTMDKTTLAKLGINY